MEYGNKIKRLVGACAKAALAVLAVAVFVHSAHAEKPLKDVSKEIGDLRGTVVSAEVLLVAPGLEQRHAYEENDLQRYARKYKVSGKEDVDSVIDIITKAGIAEAPGPLDDNNARVGVYLHTRDGSTVKLIAGADYEPATGMFNGTTPVRLKKGIEADLRNWAGSHQSSKVPRDVGQ